MRRLLIVTLLSAYVLAVNSQNEKTNDSIPYFGKHEVKINGLLLVVGAIEPSYEYLISEESSVGISALIAYGEPINEQVKYYISPYYRYYFGKKYAAGFFLEGFVMLNSSERDLDFLFFDDENDNFATDFALGIGLGGKWVTKGGFVGEINYGVGRNLFKADETEQDFIGKFGITVGYRF